MNEIYKLRYFADFKSVDNKSFKLNVYHNTSVANVEAEEVYLTDEIILRSEELDYTGTLSGESLSFSLLSTADAQFHQLYTTDWRSYKVELIELIKDESGEITNKIMYTGFTDTSLYEEPYELRENYSVSIKSTNLKVLKYVPFLETGFLSINDCITQILSNIGISTLNWETNQKYLSNKNYYDKLLKGRTDGGYFLDYVLNFLDTSIPNKYGDLKDLQINALNFFDAFEPVSCYDVLEDLLKPFGLKLIIRNMQAIITDIYSISAKVPEGTNKSSANVKNFNDILIDGGSIQMCDTYGRIKVSTDFNSSNEIAEYEIEQSEVPYDKKNIISVKHSLNPKESNPSESYRIQEYIPLLNQSIGGFNFTSVSANVKVGTVLPIIAGESDSFIINLKRSRSYGDFSNAKKLFSTLPTPLYNLNEGDTKILTLQPDKRYLKLELEAFISVRKNIYMDHDGSEGYLAEYERLSNYVYVPATVKLIGNDGNIYTLESSISDGSESWKSNWKKEDSSRNFRFVFYSGDTDKSPFIDGFAVNGQCTFPYPSKGSEIPDIVAKMKKKGCIVPLPPVSGELVIEIYDEVNCVDCDRNNDRDYFNEEELKNILYKSIKVSYCNYEGENIDIEDSYEYSANLDNKSDEVFDLETKLGSLRVNNPLSKGGLYHVNDGVRNLVQYVKSGAGSVDEYDLVERKIIFQYSDIYNKPRMKLSGTCIYCAPDSIFDSKYIIKGEDNIERVFHNLGDRHFWLSGYEWNLVKNEMDVTLLETL